MKHFFFLAMVALLLSKGYGEGESLPRAVQVHEKFPNQLYLTPSVFVFDLNTHFKGVHIKGSKPYLSLQLGYERLKPDAFYFGSDIAVGVAKDSFNEYYEGVALSKGKGRVLFARMELRSGYSVSFQKGLMTPFVGLGSCAFGYKYSTPRRFRVGMSYAAAGLLFRHELTPAFHVGSSTKLLKSIDNFEEFTYYDVKKENHRGIWGAEVSAYLIWFLGASKQWNLQLEPYFLNLNVSEKQNVYGLHLLFGYLF